MFAVWLYMYMLLLSIDCLRAISVCYIMHSIYLFFRVFGVSVSHNTILNRLYRILVVTLCLLYLIFAVL
jgi:hypothetical protein